MSFGGFWLTLGMFSVVLAGGSSATPDPPASGHVFARSCRFLDDFRASWLTMGITLGMFSAVLAGGAPPP